MTIDTSKDAEVALLQMGYALSQLVAVRPDVLAPIRVRHGATGASLSVAEALKVIEHGLAEFRTVLQNHEAASADWRRKVTGRE
jgi:hypothetical protein